MESSTPDDGACPPPSFLPSWVLGSSSSILKEVFQKVLLTITRTLTPNPKSN